MGLGAYSSEARRLAAGEPGSPSDAPFLSGTSDGLPGSPARGIDPCKYLSGFQQVTLATGRYSLCRFG